MMDDVPLSSDAHWPLRAAVLVTLKSDDHRGESVLMVERDGLSLPSSAVQPAERIPDAAARALRDDTGLDRVIGTLLTVDQTDRGSVTFIFDGGFVTEAEAAALRPASEAAGLTWTHLAEGSPRLVDRTAESHSTRCAREALTNRWPADSGFPLLFDGKPYSGAVR